MFDMILKVMFFPTVLALLVMLVYLFQPFFEELHSLYQEWQVTRSRRQYGAVVRKTHVNHRRWE